MDEEPLDPTDERLWELYIEECSRCGVKASFKDYIIWAEERDK